MNYSIMEKLKQDIQAQLCGRYNILERIGQGGMAAVYKIAAHDGTLYALKVLHSHLAADETMVQRFLDEAQNCRRLDNPHCIKVIENGRAGPYPYFTMEYLEGEDLERELKRRGALPLPEVNKLFSQVCEGIGIAHEMGIIHRDIKPANILIERDTRRTVITDFGIARAADGSRLTLTGTCMGTPAYMSPEQVEGKKNLDYRSDIYSLGIVLYEMCTGGLPFTGDSDISLATARLRNEPIRPTQFEKSLPPAVEETILQAISREPSFRFASAEALSTAFKEALSTPTPSGVTRISPAATAPTQDYSTKQEPQAPTSPLPPPKVEEGPGKKNLMILGMGAAGVVLIAIIALLAIMILQKDTEDMASKPQPMKTSHPDRTSTSAEPDNNVSTNPQPPPPPPEEQIGAIIVQWESAWENNVNSIGPYKSLYDSSFYSNYKSMDYNEWMADKRHKGRAVACIRVEISDLHVDVRGNRATASFMQKYVSNSYCDRGRKKLYFIKRGEQWKIIGEEQPHYTKCSQRCR